MKFVAVLLISTFGMSAFAYETCEQTAEKAARAIAKINGQTHANKLISVETAEDGTTTEVILDNKLGGQSVTYEITYGDSECQVSKVELIGEE